MINPCSQQVKSALLQPDSGVYFLLLMSSALLLNFMRVIPITGHQEFVFKQGFTLFIKICVSKIEIARVLRSYLSNIHLLI